MYGKALVEEDVARMSESHHETDSAVGPISDEARGVAVPISPGRENGAIPRHDDWGNDLKKVLNESRSPESTLRQIIHKIPTLAWCNLPDGSSEFLNQRWHDYTGLSPQEAHRGGWKVAIHPEDLPRLTAKWGTVSDLEPGEYEVRLRRSDGVFRWFLFRIEPLRDEVSEVVRWYGTATDIEDRKRIESLRAAEKRTLEMIADGASLRDILNDLCCSIDVEASPVISTVLLMDPDGERLWHTAGALVPRDWLPAISPVLISPHGACCGAAAFLKKRVIVADVATHINWPDEFKDLAIKNGIRAAWSEPILTKDGEVLGTFALYSSEPRIPTDAEIRLIEAAGHIALIAIERQRSRFALEEALVEIRNSENKLRTIIDTIPALAWSARPDGSAEFFNRRWLDYAGLSAEEAADWGWTVALHPEDRARLMDYWRCVLASGETGEIEARLRRFDGEFRWFLFRASPLRNNSGKVVKWYGTNTDLEDRKRAEDALRSNEQSLRLIVDSIPGFVSTFNAAGEVELQNRQVLEYTGKTAEEMKNWATSEILHPDDLPRVIDAWRRAIETGGPIDLEHRSRGADGVYRWFHGRARPQRDAEGRIVRWYNLGTDIDERKRAEDELGKAFEKIAKSEAELRTIIDAIPQLIVAIGADGNPLYANQALLEYTGLTKEEVGTERFREVFHQEDSDRLRDQREVALSRGLPFEYERRVRRGDGQYRWLLVQYNPLRDEQGKIIRWYATGTDIDERKQAEERTRQENVALREQIDQVFMFDEIVGSSPALKTVLSGIVKVAPTDSTVLITGETGTGKELIARAIHKSSQRAGHPFISVNCAAIPSSLIASELFGHEKGAFTGALQRRQGRFELAHSGTIFLDEIGDLPIETQIALLRVLQERQFERVGGSRVIPTDVRIIAATNRDLPAAIASGTFRSDLFYRLNVFPIDVPPLRNRREDVPMLVEYFVKRYAENLRKRITRIDKRTLKLCQSYHWPGNIRELQNIVERSVILCTGDTLWIDEAWLSSQDGPHPESSGPLTQNVQKYQKGLIEAALAESHGKVAGPNGAAAKLGIPPSTLHLKIKQLNITKHTIR
jgi:formate hydrogenlyase transcriptional activator